MLDHTFMTDLERESLTTPAYIRYRPLDLRYHIGVDLGQASDFSTIAVVKSNEEWMSEDGSPSGVPVRGRRASNRRTCLTFQLGHLERIPLDTPYPAVVDRIREIAAADAFVTRETTKVLGPGDFVPREVEKTAGPSMAVDVTGVGAAVGDMLRHAGLDFVGVYLTAGNTINRKGHTHYVPKVELVGPMRPALESGWLKISGRLKLYAEFRKELENFDARQNARTGHVSYETWRDGEHDDLVLAVAMSIYSGSLPRSTANVFITREWIH